MCYTNVIGGYLPEIPEILAVFMQAIQVADAAKGENPCQCLCLKHLQLRQLWPQGVFLQVCSLLQQI